MYLQSPNNTQASQPAQQFSAVATRELYILPSLKENLQCSPSNNAVLVKNKALGIAKNTKPFR